MAQSRVEFTQKLVNGCLKVLPELVGVDLYSYQLEMADRIFFSLIYGDSEEITIEAATAIRQIGGPCRYRRHLHDHPPQAGRTVSR